MRRDLRPQSARCKQPKGSTTPLLDGPSVEFFTPRDAKIKSSNSARS